MYVCAIDLVFPSKAIKVSYAVYVIMYRKYRTSAYRSRPRYGYRKKRYGYGRRRW
jgi:hypothetical protein